MIGTISGTVVVDERVFAIVGMRLRNRMIMIEARAHGPIPAGSTTSYTLHDEDGAVVVRAMHVGGIEWRAVELFETLTLVLPLAVNDRHAAGTGMAAPPIIG